MARILIVGCGCRGRALGAALIAAGHSVRGTSRREQGRREILEAGVEGAVADPDRLGTLLPLLEGVSVVCWLMGSATGEAAAVAELHGARLATMLHKLVDTPVRGMVYEAAGSAASRVLREGVAIAEWAGATHRMPVRAVDADPQQHADWVRAMRAAVEDVLAD
jgi:hypothetical protein